MEVCVRVVNSRDGDAQTLTKPDPSMSGHYKYPPVVGLSQWHRAGDVGL